MPKKIIFQTIAWEEYLYWQTTDRKILARINELLKDINRNGNKGIGKPEPLKYRRQGYWSRRIDGANRLVYKITGEQIEIAQCRGHYDD
jgi:toxin YoeB